MKTAWGSAMCLLSQTDGEVATSTQHSLPDSTLQERTAIDPPGFSKQNSLDHRQQKRRNEDAAQSGSHDVHSWLLPLNCDIYSVTGKSKTSKFLKGVGEGVGRVPAFPQWLKQVGEESLSPLATTATLQDAGAITLVLTPATLSSFPHLCLHPLATGNK